MSPIWTKVISDGITKSAKKCPHCKKTSTYSRKQPGRFYTCKRCGHRFKERG